MESLEDYVLLVSFHDMPDIDAASPSGEGDEDGRKWGKKVAVIQGTSRRLKL